MVNKGRTGSNDEPLAELFSTRQWRGLRDEFDLTPRQLEVVRFVCRGWSNTRIGTQLRISPNTVRMHLKGVFAKLEVHDRVGVVVRPVDADRRLQVDGHPSRARR